VSRFEDSPPCIPPRAPRQSTIRSKAPVAASRYLVCWGLGEAEREVPTFAEALALYVEHQSARGGVQIWNLELCDDAANGLSESEQEAVALADEMFTVQLAV
jgi:hypothetical protein